MSTGVPADRARLVVRVGRNARVAGGCAALALVAATGACGDNEPNFGSKQYPPRPPSGPPGRFDPSSVRAYFYFNEPYGQRREIHFVARGPRKTHVGQARQCVGHHLDREVTAPFCFAYPSQRAFQAARFTSSNGQTFKNCWSARAQKPADAPLSADVLDPEGAMGEEGCPDLPR